MLAPVEQPADLLRKAEDDLFDGFAVVGWALSNGRRAGIIELHAQTERTVEEVAAPIDQTLANTSHHVRPLAKVGLVTSRRGGHVTYRFASDGAYDAWAAVRERRLVINVRPGMNTTPVISPVRSRHHLTNPRVTSSPTAAAPTASRRVWPCGCSPWRDAWRTGSMTAIPSGNGRRSRTDVSGPRMMNRHGFPESTSKPNEGNDHERIRIRIRGVHPYGDRGSRSKST